MKQGLTKIRLLLGLVAFGLFVSGVTVFPALPELRWFHGLPCVQAAPVLRDWIGTCITGLSETGQRFPFLFYAGDWLAFAHIMLAVLFLGAIKDPVRNRWIVQFGMISCVAVIPLALICGPLRGIPWFWRVVDCAFVPAAGLPLWLAWRGIRKMEKSRT